MFYYDVALPTPWWTLLTYTSEKEIENFCRVVVPLGRAHAIGLVVAKRDDSNPNFKLKNIEEVIDRTPPLDEVNAALISWFSNTFFVSFGLAAKALLPSKFFSKKEIFEKNKIFLDTGKNFNTDKKFNVMPLYSSNKQERFAKYQSKLEELCNKSIDESGTALVAFPRLEQAKKFWDQLPSELKKNGTYWAADRGFKCYKETLEGKFRFIIGTISCIIAPLKNLSLCIAEDEANPAWYSDEALYYNGRTLLLAKAKIAKSAVILGGAMPSANSFLSLNNSSNYGVSKDNINFISTKIAQATKVDGVQLGLTISKPLITETRSELNKGNFVFWILDRKNYASETECLDCGYVPTCKRCGTTLRVINENVLKCPSCGTKAEHEKFCPNCGGVFFQAEKPGLYALYDELKKHFKSRIRKLFLVQEPDLIDAKETPFPKANELKEKFPYGALILGTRKILDLAEELAPSVIGFIDLENLYRQNDHRSNFFAYFTIFSSYCESQQRPKIIIQTSHPLMGWQKTLISGYNFFWKDELNHRREWELPPFAYVVIIRASENLASRIEQKLQEHNFDAYASEDVVYCKTHKLAELRTQLAEFFNINNKNKDFPKIQIFLE